MWMGEDGSLHEGICRDFPTWGAETRGQITDWERLGWRWQRQWSPRDLRGFPMSVCGADLGARKVIPVRNPAGEKLFPARWVVLDKHFEACDFYCCLKQKRL